MHDGERRRLVFTNLCNGLPIKAVMEALHMSEVEVMADFDFVSIKVRSYRFERVMPPVACKTIPEARANRVDVLFTISRLNLGKEAVYSKIETLPFMDGSGGTMSDAERVMLEMRMRAGR